jgi:hypothetical protein
MEFTDLFIALARANGIPAREINGFAYTNNSKTIPLGITSDILHSWPEYYDFAKKVWVPVDPTWENTTEGVDYFSQTDLNHFAFVIHGENSQAPYPAGAYKDENSPERDVSVEYTPYEPASIMSSVKIDYGFPPDILMTGNYLGTLIIVNDGPTAIYNQNMNLTAQNLIETQTNLSSRFLKNIPPYGHQNIDYELHTKSSLKSQNGTLSLQFGNQVFTQPVKIGSLLDISLAQISAFFDKIKKILLK